MACACVRAHEQGLELSLCGQLLQPGMSYQDVALLFDSRRVDPADWAEKVSRGALWR